MPLSFLGVWVTLTTILEHLSWARYHVPQLISFTPNLKTVGIFPGMGDIMNDNNE